MYTGLLVGISLIASIYFTRNQVGIDVIGVGTSIGAGLAAAGVLSTQEIEHIQRVHNVKSLEESDLVLQLQAIGLNRYFLAGVTPIAGIAIVTFPFVLQNVYLTMLQATLVAIALSLLSLFLFGAWIGSRTRQIWYLTGIRAGIFGAVTAVLSSIFV